MEAAIQISHAKNFEYLDKNHGAIFNIWDKLFRTWKSFDKNIDIEYGVIHAPNSYHPLTILTHEYKSIWKDVKRSKNFNEAFNYVFGPPGWKPDSESTKVNTKQLINLK